MIRNFSPSFTLLLVILDTTAILLAITVAEWQRLNIELGLPGNERTFGTPLGVYVILTFFWLLILNNVGAYSPRQTYRATIETMHLIRAILLAVLVFSGLFYIVYRDFSRLQLAYLLINLMLINIGFRLLLRIYYRLSGGRKYDARRVLIIGTGKLAKMVGLQVRSYAWTGLYLVGYIDFDNDKISQYNTSNAQDGVLAENIIGTYSNLKSLLKEHIIDEVIFALERPDYSELLTSTQALYREEQIRVRIAPDLQEIAYIVTTVEDLEGIPLIGLRDHALTLPQRMTKRLIDIVVSGMLILITLPLMLVIMLLVVLDSPGSPFFVQERLAQGKRTFKMIKFRTMVKDAEKRQAEVNRYDEQGRLIHKSRDDARITRIGHFLRKTSLDEIPQFFNIFKGDMSLVGPRPEIPWMLDNYEEWQMKRFEVPQGLTGWWQINGRSDTPMHLATEDDIFYIINYSLTLDIIILLRTPYAVVKGKGAF